MDGHPARRHPAGDGRVSFDLGPSQIAVAVQLRDGSWTGWVEPLADRIRLNTVRLRRAQRRLDRQHRAGSPGCFNPDGTHKPGRCAWERSPAARRSSAGVAEQHRRLAERRKTLHGALANRLFAYGVEMACEKLDYVAWQKNFPRSVRDRAPGVLVETIRRKAESAGGDRLYEYNTKNTALSQPACAGTARKSRSHNGSTAAGAASPKIGTCSRPTSDCTSELAWTGLIGWTCRQPTGAGCTVRTSTGRRSPVVVLHRSGEAADIRPRGGQRRASTPSVKPKPRCDRAARREPPLPTSPRR